MKIVEKEGSLPVFDTFETFFSFFLSTAEINARFMGKIGENLTVVEGLNTALSYYATDVSW